VKNIARDRVKPVLSKGCYPHDAPELLNEIMSTIPQWNFPAGFPLWEAATTRVAAGIVRRFSRDMQRCRKIMKKASSCHLTKERNDCVSDSGAREP
jgi:hypothetical protein